MLLSEPLDTGDSGTLNRSMGAMNHLDGPDIARRDSGESQTPAELSGGVNTRNGTTDPSHLPPHASALLHAPATTTNEMKAYSERENEVNCGMRTSEGEESGRAGLGNTSLGNGMQLQAAPSITGGLRSPWVARRRVRNFAEALDDDSDLVPGAFNVTCVSGGHPFTSAHTPAPIQSTSELPVPLRGAAPVLMLGLTVSGAPVSTTQTLLGGVPAATTQTLLGGVPAATTQTLLGGVPATTTQTLWGGVPPSPPLRCTLTGALAAATLAGTTELSAPFALAPLATRLPSTNAFSNLLTRSLTSPVEHTAARAPESLAAPFAAYVSAQPLVPAIVEELFGAPRAFPGRSTLGALFLSAPGGTLRVPFTLPGAAPGESDSDSDDFNTASPVFQRRLRGLTTPHIYPRVAVTPFRFPEGRSDDSDLEDGPTVLAIPFGRAPADYPATDRVATEYTRSRRMPSEVPLEYPDEEVAESVAEAPSARGGFPTAVSGLGGAPSLRSVADRALFSLRANPAPSRIRRAHSLYAAPLAPPNNHLPHTDLETTTSPRDSLPRISPAQLSRALTGSYRAPFDRVQVYDCRFEYEFNGGHITSARHMRRADLLELLSAGVTGKVLLVFHCEFSQKRGPEMAAELRRLDRVRNKDVYPRLNFPDVAILDGGYERFYAEQREHCGGYVEMDHPEYIQECSRGLDGLRHVKKKSLVRAHTFAGSSMRSQAFRDQPVMTSMPAEEPLARAPASGEPSLRVLAAREHGPKRQKSGNLSTDFDTGSSESPASSISSPFNSGFKGSTDLGYVFPKDDSKWLLQRSNTGLY